MAAKFAALQVIRPVVGILTYALAGALGWFIHPLFAIVLFIFMVIYHARTSEGICAPLPV
jgi:hypothetical protein